MLKLRPSRMLLVSMLFVNVQVFAQGVIYVDHDASSGGDGLSWATAYQSLQDALWTATQGGISEIRVAEGTYRPDLGQRQTQGDRTATFQLLNGVAIRGGYAGVTAGDPNVRDLRLSETVLDGGNSSYHVVTGSGTDATAILEGVAIQGGRADGSSGNVNNGAGMLSSAGSPTVVSCSFRSNYAVNRGGGIYSENAGNLKLINCLMVSNEAGYGGAVYSSRTATALVNCTVANNYADQPDGAGGIDVYSSTLSLRNCILAGNYSPYQQFSYLSQYQGGSPATIEHSLVQMLPGSLLPFGNIGGFTDPKFIASNDYRLDASSPCIDSGDADALPADISDVDQDSDTAETIPLDRDGQPRLRNCLPDMGAYEAVTERSSPIRVDLDDDCDVDLDDFQQFAACGSAPGVPNSDPACLVADFDFDADVDQSDFGLFQVCYSGSGSLGHPDCLPPSEPTLVQSSYVRTSITAGSTCPDDYLEVIPSHGELHVIHHGANYNCCVPDINVQLTVSDHQLSLVEWGYGGTCTCRGCFDVEAVIAGLKPGTYTVTMEGHTMDVEVP